MENKGQRLIYTTNTPHTWSIYIGKKILDNIPELANLARYTRLALVMDRQVAKLYEAEIVAILRNGGIEPLVIIIPGGEAAKSLAEVERVYRKLLNAQFDRKSALIAFGGGVVGDITGFVAATYLRGIEFIQLPTTLLAQVDASIGGKTGVNFQGLKNMIGAFYQPRMIISDISLLRSLPQREFRSGLAEVVKYGLIKDKSIFALLEQKRTNLSEDELEFLVTKSSKIKGKIVERDERETSGVRELLNFGHTLGHAVETLGKGKYTHGEAISLGMVFAARLSLLCKMLAVKEYERIVSLLEVLGLPTTCSLSMAVLLKKIVYDKKSVRTKPRWVLLKKIGKGITGQVVAQKTVQLALKEIIR